MESKIFPLYRRLSHGRNYYRIDAPDQLTELMIVGNSWMEILLEARQYPERMFIRDLIELVMPGMEEITEEQFQTFREYCQSSKTFRTM